MCLPVVHGEVRPTLRSHVSGEVRWLWGGRHGCGYVEFLPCYIGAGGRGAAGETCRLVSWSPAALHGVPEQEKHDDDADGPGNKLTPHRLPNRDQGRCLGDVLFIKGRPGFPPAAYRDVPPRAAVTVAGEGLLAILVGAQIPHEIAASLATHSTPPSRGKNAHSHSKILTHISNYSIIC